MQVQADKLEKKNKKTILPQGPRNNDRKRVVFVRLSFIFETQYNIFTRYHRYNG